MNRFKIVAIAAVTVALAAAAVANALIVQVGDLILKADGGFAPKALPKHENAPIKIYGGGTLSTKSGELPPILDTINVEFDRHGAVDTLGLPVCKQGKLEATTSPQARRACPDAIVGKGNGSAIVQFPESKPIPVSSPITIFNGPKKGRNPTVLAHAYTTVPVPTTFIVPVVIEKINKGVYGYRTKAKIPKIANEYGHPTSGNLTIDRKWTFKGKKHSYVNARCETGHLQARVEATFKNGDFLSGVFIRACKVRK